MFSLEYVETIVFGFYSYIGKKSSHKPEINIVILAIIKWANRECFKIQIGLFIFVKMSRVNMLSVVAKCFDLFS